MAATGKRRCSTCKGRRRVVVKGAVVDCPTCKGQGAKETELRLFNPVMEAML